MSVYIGPPVKVRIISRDKVNFPKQDVRYMICASCGLEDPTLQIPKIYYLIYNKPSKENNGTFVGAICEDCINSLLKESGAHEKHETYLATMGQTDYIPDKHPLITLLNWRSERIEGGDED